jgi:hypothetical protein
MKNLRFYLLCSFAFFLFHSLVHAQTSNLFSFLESNHLKLVAGISQFDSAYNNRLTTAMEHIFDNNQLQMKTDSSEWLVKIDGCRYDSVLKGFLIKVLFVCTRGQVRQANVALKLKFNQWQCDNYVLMPACAYNGNRFESRRIGYSPKLYDVRDMGVGKPMIISDVPRLNNRPGLSSISVRSGDLSDPVVGIQSPGSKSGVLFFFKPSTQLGDNGIRITESRDRNTAEINLTAPVVREGNRYFIADNQVESQDNPASFNAGDSILLDVGISAFPASDIQSLYNRLFDSRAAFSCEAALTPIFSLSSCFKVQEKKFNEQNFFQEYGYYSVGMRESYSQDWQIGWVGGMISTYPLLFAGDETTKNNVIRNFDWLFPNGIAPSGFFYDSGEKGTIWYGGGKNNSHTQNWHLIRKSCDAIYYIIKQFQLMEKLGIPVKQTWKDGTRQVTDALVKLWETNGEFGQFVNSLTGEIEVGGSTSAALAPAALILAGDYFGNGSFIEVAIASADFMYQKYVSKGITCGGPGDALQNPDSESAYAMLESFIVLYEHTNDQLWLTRAKEMAHQFATWVMPYNYQFPEISLFGKLKMQTVGTVWANTQNKHSAPGICTHSGIALFRLYRATGDERYLKLLQQIAFAIPQYLSHPMRPIPGMKEGWMSERINTTDWLEGIGEMMYGTTWAETSLMLTYIEIPGLYIVPDKDICLAFDHVQCRILKSSTQTLTIEVRNTTKTDADVRVFIENSVKMKQALPENYLLNSKIIRLKAGESQVFNYYKTF